MQPRIGRRYGRLTVKGVHEYDPVVKRGNHIYLCECDCGGVKSVRWRNLAKGHTKSCGCLIAARRNKDIPAYNNDIGSKHPLYQTWVTMIRRCYVKASVKYKVYGAKGVRVCQRWLDSAQAFVDDMGDKPSKDHTLDRIDVAGDYTPENCRWADRYTQALNARGEPTSHPTKIGPETKFISEWCRQLGIKPDSVSQDMKKGHPPDVAIVATWMRRRMWLSGGGNYNTCYKKAKMYLQQCDK